VMSKLDQHRETTQEASTTSLSSMQPSFSEW